jgi:branched-chain amino acid transport system permease protein
MFVLMVRPLVSAGVLARLLPSYALAAVPALALFAGAVLVIETAYHLLVHASDGPAMRVFWISYEANSPVAWLSFAALLAAGFLAFRRTWPIVSGAWHEATLEARQKPAK